MKYGVLGTGDVAQTIASKLVELGHEVMMGSRTANNEKAVAWAAANGDKASSGTFADAAAFGERVFNCVQEGVSKVTFWYALFQFLFHIVAWASPPTLVNASSFLWVRRVQRLHVPP